MGSGAPPLPALSHPCDYTPKFSTKRAGKNDHFPVFPWKGYSCILSQLLPESLASNLGAHCSHSPWDTGGSWYTLNYREPLRMKTVDNHKGLKGNQESQPGWLIRFIPCKTILSRLGEVAVLCNAQTPTQLGKMKEKRNMFQREEQISGNQF